MDRLSMILTCLGYREEKKTTISIVDMNVGIESEWLSESRMRDYMLILIFSFRSKKNTQREKEPKILLLLLLLLEHKDERWWVRWWWIWNHSHKGEKADREKESARILRFLMRVAKQNLNNRNKRGLTSSIDGMGEICIHYDMFDALLQKAILWHIQCIEYITRQ